MAYAVSEPIAPSPPGATRQGLAGDALNHSTPNGKPSARGGAGVLICRAYALVLTVVAYAAGAWDLA